jgi:hypothetical protein
VKGGHMDKLKYIRVQLEDGSYSKDVPIAPDAKNVELEDGRNLQEALDNFENQVKDQINLETQSFS